MSIVRNGSLAVAITLALGVSHAQATTFNVTNTNDSGAGSLRQALLDAAADTNTPHTISLAAIAGQTIEVQDRLEFAPSVGNMDLTIQGSDVTVASDGSDGVFAFFEDYDSLGYGYAADLVVEINDMTITGGVTGSVFPQGAERGLVGAGAGGGVYFFGASYTNNALRLENVTVTGNEASAEGGGVAVYGGHLVIDNSTISDNLAVNGGGVAHYGPTLEVSNSLITDNRSESSEPIFRSEERLFARRSETRGGAPILGGNVGGIVSYSSDGASISDSTISGNSADGSFGGADIVSEYGDVSLSRSTVAGNTSGGFGGGVILASYDGSVTVRGSTISGNVSEGPVGGVAAATYAGGSILIENSTISDNTAGFEVGGLVAVRFDYGGRIGNGSIDVNFSTIFGNTSEGGTAGATLLSDPYYIGRGGPITDPSVNGSIISGNLASGVASDLDADPGLIARGGEEGASNDRGVPPNINVNLSLLGSSTQQLTLDGVSQNLLGEDPLLGPLADNGGPTLSHLPGGGSPAIGVVPLGQLGCGSPIDEDQTGGSRPDGDGCTLGSVEFRGTPPPVAAPVAVPVGNPLAMLLMAGLMGLAGLFGLRRRRRA